MALQYSFLPTVRRGLARAYSATDGGAGLEARPKVQVGLALTATAQGAAAPAVQGAVALRLYGPADVAGVDPRLIVRTEPRPRTANFEPNYLAAIDFDPPDFPWMFTPAKADANKRLRPWLVLVVLDRDAGVAPPRMAGGPLPRISLTAAQSASELPRLSDSWMWAHGQVVTNTGDMNEVQAVLRQAPAQTVSRLVAMRRLKPQTRYVACLVPAFEPGRATGLGLAAPADPEAPIALAPAWPDDPQARGALDLPVYYHWEFSTGQLGDFETLARRLLTPANYPKNLDPGLQQELASLGTAPVRLDSDKVLTAGGAPIDVLYEGALVSLELGTNKLPSDDLPDAGVAGRLADIVNTPDAMNLARGPSDRVPTVSPPLYGCWPEKQYTVQPSQLNKRWIADLNLDPRYRLAAGYGAEIVRQRQDLYMQSCWSQVGEVLAAQRALNAGRLAAELAKSLIGRSIARLPPGRVLAVLGPARTRLLAAAGVTVQGAVAKTSLPNAAFDPAMRRQFSAQRPALKAAVARATGVTNAAAAAGVAAQVGQLYNAMANATKNVGLIDPNRATPDGILGTHLFDDMTLPATGATIDLGPLLGIERVETLATVRKLKSDAAALAKKPPSRVAPDLSVIKKQGFLTQDTQAQIALALSRSGSTLSRADVAKALLGAAAKATQDVSITLTRGQGSIVVAPVKRLPIGGLAGSGIDAGKVIGAKPVAARKASTSVTVQVSGRAASGRAASAGAASGLTRPELATSAAGRAASGIAIGGGAVKFPLETPKTKVSTFTFTAPLKDSAFLTAITAAFPDLVGRVDQWKNPGVKVSAIDFALNATASSALGDIDPARTMTARVSSMLSVADQRLAYKGAGNFGVQAIVSQRAQLVPGVSRYVVPVTLDRVMAYPSIPEAAYGPLSSLLPDAFMPGAENIPNDFVLLVKTNPRFVESFMVGMNHEMGRELLWRGYPTDQRGTPFRQFWDRLDGKLDIAPIDRWNRYAQLGSQGAANAEQNSWLVLLVRGELLQRFPNTVFYAQRKSTTGNTLATLNDFAEKDLICNPTFGGVMAPNITFVGFPIPAAERAKWCFVVEEQMTEPRFGFDEHDSQRVRQQDPAKKGWKDVNWDDTGVAADRYFNLADVLRANAALPTTARLPANPHAANLASAMLQRPFKGFWLSGDLEPQV